MGHTMSGTEEQMRRVLFIGDRLFMKFPDFDYFHERLAEVNAEVISTAGMSDAEIVEAAHDAVALVDIARPITAEMIQACPSCRIIMTLSVGFDAVDVAEATRHGIPVSNCPLYCSSEVAEHALTLALALSRKIDILHRHVNGGGWDYKHARTIHSHRTQVFGIIGLGRIGRYSARKAAALGMHVIAYDPYVDDDVFAMLGVERFYDLEPMLETADIVTIHSPLTDETWHMIDSAALERMKSTAVIVNTARGSIIDQTALEDALENGTIAGAGIDVLETEPPVGTERILNLPTAIVTPHVAWYSEESHTQNMIDGLNELVRALQCHRPRYVVNPQIYSRR
jgi:D-3-phosphoglycerate dehydrogenase